MAPTFCVSGGRALQGTIRPAGNKNAALPILAATLLADAPCRIENVPHIRDVETMLALLQHLGALVEWIGPNTVQVDARPAEPRELEREPSRSRPGIENAVALADVLEVAHDGDADRALFADAEGRVIDGDQVLAACAIALKEDGVLERNTVVSTVMANTGFLQAMRKAGIDVVESKVGDRYVLEEMLRTGAMLGGEQSGHVIFRHHATTGDGLLTAVTFLSLAAKRGCTVAELASVMRKFPQVVRNVSVTHKERLESAGEVWEAVRGVERELDGSGRVLVRASGTEPLVRVMVEAESEADAGAHADALAAAVGAALR